MRFSDCTCWGIRSSDRLAVLRDEKGIELTEAIAEKVWKRAA